MQQKTNPKVSVLIVDDSSVSQKLYKHILAEDETFEIIGCAYNGREAISFLEKQKPDVVSMDINMPVMDGIAATREIMQTYPVPIVVSSSLYDPSQQEMAMEVLEAGAVSIIPKPSGPGHVTYARDANRYRRMLKSMAEVKVVRRKYLGNKKTGPAEKIQHSDAASYRHSNYTLIVIGASAGGPEGVKTILSALNTEFPLPVLVVQHIDQHFTEGYRLWLQSYTSAHVVLAGHDQILLPGHVYIAPGSKHMILKKEGLATLDDKPAFNGHKPSVNHLFESAAEVYKNKTIAVLLSGMGVDGAFALKKLKDSGAYTFAQDKASCLVFGMPGEAVKLHAAIQILSPVEIANQIVHLFK